MDGIRFSLVLPGRSAGDLIAIARWADHWNLAAVWIGDPHAAAANSDDSYVTTTAAALAGVTDSLRLGAFLTLRGSASVERVADDVGVVDQMSGGRLELALVAPESGGDNWAQAATGLLRAWNEWPLGDTGDTVPATPQPQQPVIPRVVVGAAAHAVQLIAGRMIFEDDVGALGHAGDTGVRPRTVLLIEPSLEEGTFGWLQSDPKGRLRDLRRLAADAGATEIALVVDEDHELTEYDVKVLGTVIVPCLRAYGAHSDMIVGDAWSWLTEKADIHEAPASAGNLGVEAEERERVRS